MAYEKRGNNGGVREGAGRPRLEATVLRRVLIEKLEENAEPIAQALIDKGLEGDVPALRELLDRGLGRPQASVDVTSKGKELGVILYPTKDEGPLETDAKAD